MVKFLIRVLVVALASNLLSAQEIRSYDSFGSGGRKGWHVFSLENNTHSRVNSQNTYSWVATGGQAVDSNGIWWDVGNYWTQPMRGIVTNKFDPLLGDFPGVNNEVIFPIEVEEFLNGAVFDDNDLLHVLISETHHITHLRNWDAQIWSVDTTTGVTDNSPNLVCTSDLDYGFEEDMRGLDSYDGKYYSMHSPGGLVEIDFASGNTTFLFPHQYVPNSNRHDRWHKGLCISDTGVFYTAVWRYRYLPGQREWIPLRSDLCIIDMETGVYSPINQYKLPANHSGETRWTLEFFEGATPAQALWQSGTSDAGAFAPMKVKGNGVNPGDQVALYFTTHLTARNAIIPAGLPGAGLRLDIGGRVKYMGTATANIDGEYELGPNSVPSAFINNLLIQGINLNNQKVTNFFRVTE